MKLIELNKNQILSNEEKEKFFQQLEKNSKFFKEAFEAMLSIVISDPVLTYQVADLIETNYRNLYLALLKNQVQIEKEDVPNCCKTPKS